MPLHSRRCQSMAIASVLALTAASSCTRSLNRAERHRIECHHFPNGEPALCELASDGGISVARESLAEVSFGPEGLGTVIIEKKDLYFVTRQGKTAPALN